MRHLVIRFLLSVAIIPTLLSASLFAEGNADSTSFAPPAVPLVACDPYFSIWSAAKNLTDTGTTHWTGKSHRLASMIRIDGKAFRLMGDEPSNTPALKQVALDVLPTRTIYQFAGAGVSVELTFMTPALPEDIDLLSRPITYVSYSIESTDGKTHAASIYLSAAGELTVNTQDQLVNASAETLGKVDALKIGSVYQPILRTKGDDLRIDWGYLYLATEQGTASAQALGTASELENAFVEGNFASKASASLSELKAREVTAAIVLDAGKVGSTAVNCWALLAYDDLYSIEYMGSKLRPYWRRNGLEAEGLLNESVRDYAALTARCVAFDKELMSDLEQIGGIEYAKISALAFRQCFAAGKFAADANGQPIQFSKENNSNGCVATSDVFYPMAPQFLMFGPSLAKSFVVPFMEYAASDRWTFPFAPHDLGTYPKANGQVYGGGETSEENQMPVEESGNLLILMAAIADLDGDTSFADRYWPQLTQWAEYLKQEGFDPDNQLCTDDFAGHMAHNVNLSAKAICGLGSYAKLCEMRGDAEEAAAYRATAEDFAKRWVEGAADGDHYRLAFDKPGSWSQKYNLVWDRVLGLNLFPESVLKKEMAYYRSIQSRYGLALDNRRTYTKLDWILWTATLTQDREDFEALVHPVYRFLEETRDRVPMTDWYETKSGKQVGFKARPVVGGVLMQVLHNQPLWKKWASRDKTNAGDYANMPIPPKVTVYLANGVQEPATWRYSKKQPAGNWQASDYDDSNWKSGKSGFGSPSNPNPHTNTIWKSSDIWLRRDFDVKLDAKESLMLNAFYDEDAEFYINGVLAAEARGYTTSYEQLVIREEARATLKETGNVMSIHCHQTVGGQYIDAGLVTVEEVQQ